ncbi:hypothetical protein ACS0TY_026953 [Phlomoides rotata]
MSGGACGYENTYEAGFGENTAALSSALFRGGEACGSCYQVICNRMAEPKWCLRRGSVTVTATNFCPSNNQGGWCDPPRHHFDMSTPAFFRIARQGNEGVVPVLYRRVACRRRGGVRFLLKGQPNFNIIMISNVGGGGDIKTAWIRGSRSRTWSAMHRNWGANWQSNYDLRSQTLSFRITLVNGRTLTFLNVVPSSWNFFTIELLEFSDSWCPVVQPCSEFGRCPFECSCFGLLAVRFLVLKEFASNSQLTWLCWTELTGEFARVVLWVEFESLKSHSTVEALAVKSVPPPNSMAVLQSWVLQFFVLN